MNGISSASARLRQHARSPSYRNAAFFVWMLLTTTWLTSNLRAETTAGSGAIEITDLPCQITTSGTYYLATDLSINADIAYAISITAPNVTIDLNGHTITQLYTADNGTMGVYVNANNVAVRNGILTGFLWGLDCWGDNTLIEDVSVQADTYCGLSVWGNGAHVRNCRVSNIGGSTAPPGGNPYAFGIAVQGGSNSVVMDCDVTTLTPGPGGGTICIYLASASNAVVVNNRMSASNWGCFFIYSTGEYRDNLCAPGISISYDVRYTPMTDAGNNQ